MALLILILIFIALFVLAGHRQKEISPKKVEQNDELITVIIPTINSKK